MERTYLVTERAHFMCPNMHFGILAELSAPYDRQRVLDTLEREAAAHPFLRSVIRYEEETDRLYYDVQPQSRIIFEEVVPGRTAIGWMEELARQDWDPFHNGLLRVCVLPDDGNARLLFAAHHLLCDGRGLLRLVQEFAEWYVRGTEPAFAEERLIRSAEDLPDGSRMPLISRLLVRQANRRWKKEGARVSYERYAAFVKQYAADHLPRYEEQTVSAEDYQQLLQSCREQQVTVTDWLTAGICIQNSTDRLILAADIRKDLPCYREGALGNYAAAFTVATPKKGTLPERARAVHDAVRGILADNRKKMLVLSCYLEMEPTLLDAAAISALGGFDSKAASFVGGGMFGMAKPTACSLTNLGRIESETIRSAAFYPPASPAARVTVGALTVNDTMTICLSRNGERQ